ncbi:MAG: radical SAM protein [Candidatus Aenigmatarchaeota archaeon]
MYWRRLADSELFYPHLYFFKLGAIDLKEYVLERTKSIDSEAYLRNKEIKIIGANYVLKKDNNVYLVKENGEEERIGSYEWWKRAKEFESKKVSKIYSEKKKSCDLNCGSLCGAHKNKTALLNVVVTNRCNLSCPYCFFYASESNFVYEPSIEEIEKMIISAKEINGFVPPVQLTGGEPTLRNDLDKIIKCVKSLNSPHIQLNTNGVLPAVNFYYDAESTIKDLKKLKRSGLNTIYLSFDGTDAKTNIKNYYEFPLFLQACRESGIESIVLVPTIHAGNLNEVWKIVKIAVKNFDIIRGIVFQPISFVGGASKSNRERYRATISDIIEELYPVGLDIKDFYPVSAIESFADIVSSDKDHVTFYNNSLCGMATYITYDQKNDKIIPITHYIDVDRLLKDLNLFNSLIGKFVFLFKYLSNPSLIDNIKKYVKIERTPDGSNIMEIIKNIREKGDYNSLGEFHKRVSFIGMMHFMDPYNYDVERVERCNIHYASPDGRVIPFCAYNVFPEIYRDKILKKYALDKEAAERLIKEEKENRKKVIEFRKNEKVRENAEKKYKEWLGEVI